MSEPVHQLAAILFADIVGYSSMMNEDEQKAFESINHFKEILEIIAGELNGRIIQYFGDGCLVLFNSSTDAAEFAKLLQADLNEEPRISARVGIHMGDVLIHEGNAFGDVVNIAARLQTLAPVGGIYISEMVYRNIINKQGLDCRFIREEKLKNIRETVRIYELLTPNSQPLPKEETEESIDPKDRSRTSIAVLPFYNISNNEEQEYFSDGITEDIITQLAKIKSFRVVSRTSVMQYKKNPKSVKEISRELGVSVILEGSVQRSHEQIRITAQLIDAKTDEHLWAESFDRNASDIFSIQREVAVSIADVLNAKLSLQEARQLDTAPTINPEAYDLFLKGKSLVETRRKPDVLMARELFQQAVTRDKNFASAYSSLAVTYLLSSFRGYEDSVKMLWMAKQHIDTALSLNPSSGETHASLGYWYHQKFEWHAAEVTYRRAIELNPTQTNVYLWLAILLEGEGNLEALDTYDKGNSINPGWDYLLQNKVRCLVNAGEENEAIELQKKLVEKSSKDAVKHSSLLTDLARLYWNTNHKEEAIKSAMEARNTGLAKMFEENDGSLLEAQISKKYKEMRDNSEYISHFWMGMDYAKSGISVKALECFNNAIALKEVAITLLLMGHFEFVNIKYLNLALMKRKIRMMVNF